MGTVAILQISAAAYGDIRNRLTALDARLNPMPSYADEYISPRSPYDPERLVFGPVAFEALPAKVEDFTDAQREQIATILETVARDGLKGPRDLDVALDAIGCALR